MLALGLLALVFASPAAAHVLERPNDNMSLRQTVAFQERVIRHDRRVLGFFQQRRWMLARYNEFRPAALRTVVFHRKQLAWTQRELAENRRKLELREPRAAICHVFGRHCRAALAVARCESSFSTTARNGGYRGLFQMGRPERARYGHGPTALAQARAAHRYFVEVGQRWFPWPVCGRRVAS